jgi:hypothetical protein
VYCDKGELNGEPLLTANTDGEGFLAHRSCLDLEAFDRTIDVTGASANRGRAPDLRPVASCPVGAGRRAFETSSADPLKSDGGTVSGGTDANAQAQTEPNKLGTSGWRMRL